MRKTEVELRRQFGAEPPPLAPRYNIAPTQPVLAVRQVAPGGSREFAVLRWGLVPPRAPDAHIGNKLINARAESLAARPAFRASFRRRRCLVVADGFYEWKQEGRRKQPYHIRLSDGAAFAFAGLWESWQGDPASDPSAADPSAAAADRLETCTIVTTEANDLLRELHDRMPVILSPADYALWLDPSVQDPPTLSHLLAPYPSDEMELQEASLYVNNARHEGPACLEAERRLF